MILQMCAMKQKIMLKQNRLMKKRRAFKHNLPKKILLNIFFPQLAKVDNGFGNVYFHLHNYQQAGLHYDRALKNYKKLTEKNPDVYSMDEADVLFNIGSLNIGTKEL